MILLWRPSKARLAGLLRASRDAPYSYRDVGATREQRAPAGFRGSTARGRLGEGEAVFRRAADAVLRFQVQRRAGLGVIAETPTAQPGAVLICTMPVGPVVIVIPCRIVYLLDEPDRAGFGYGTLPGHPESGEEAFVVERDRDGGVWLRVTAFSRPDGLLQRITHPVGRVVQQQVTERYVAGMQRYLRSGA
ncbi:MAG TPA: DUF1990 domain-containing protein [Micromonosporaceae bacterium]